MYQAFTILAIYPNYIFQLYSIYVPSVLSVLSVSHQYPINVLTISHDNTAYKYGRISAPKFYGTTGKDLADYIRDLHQWCKASPNHDPNAGH